MNIAWRVKAAGA